MAKKLKNLLPKKLSDCLEVALEDTDKAKAAGYTILMNRWYVKKNGTCSVCLAGAVLAREFDINRDEDIQPWRLSLQRLITEHDENRLYALNYLRQGYIHSALSSIGQLTPEYEDCYIPVHDFGMQDTPKWRKDMKKIAQYLRSEGL